MNHLIIWQDLLVFWGSNPRPIANHGHPMIQLVLSEENPFVSKGHDGHWYEKKGMLIGPNCKHECDATDLRILTVGIDPESSMGEWILQRYLSAEKVVEIPSQILPAFDWASFFTALSSENWSGMYGILEAYFRLPPGHKRSGRLDERIEAILHHIATNIHVKLDTKTLTGVAHLSESRLLHLFKEQMGLPIRNYIQWYRLQLALKCVLRGAKLTQAAHEAGFADQAHLSRTCVNMMGVPPSLIVKNSKFIQVSFPS